MKRTELESDAVEWKTFSRMKVRVDCLPWTNQDIKAVAHLTQATSNKWKEKWPRKLFKWCNLGHDTWCSRNVDIQRNSKLILLFAQFWGWLNSWWFFYFCSVLLLKLYIIFSSNYINCTYSTNLNTKTIYTPNYTYPTSWIYPASN